MKKILLILIALPMIGFGQNVNIPDANFKAFLLTYTTTDTNGDSEIQVSEAAAFTGLIYCPNQNISDLTGIEAFTGLTELFCQFNQLTSIDLSNNTNLVKLICYGNNLRRLNVKNGNNTNFNQFMTTGASSGAIGNTELGCITVDDANYSTNNWSNIDAHSYFSSINCVNEMTYVPDDNFEQALIGLGIDLYLDDSVATFQMNSITHLSLNNLGISDLTGIEDCISLATLYFGNNSTGPNNTITGVIDLSNSINIEKVYGAGAVNGNIITNVIFNSSNNYTLTHLLLSGNQITNIDLTKLYALEYLYLENNPLNSLDLSSNTMLSDLSFGFYSNNPTNPIIITPISNIDLSANTLLYSLSFWNTQITSLDVSNHPNLQTLEVRHNQLTSINTNGAIDLKYFNCFSNQLTSLDLSTNSSIENLLCYNNQLTSLDLSNNPNLNYLDCSSNQLTSLDLRSFTLGNVNSGTLFLFQNSNWPAGTTSPQNSVNNPNLYCIDVDSTYIFASPSINLNSVLVTDTFSNFSLDCSQAYGCIDTLACNYNSLSLFSDSSCVYPNSNQQSFSICVLDSVLVGSSVYDTTGNYIDTLVNFSGCDSIVYTSVNLLPSTVLQWGVTICDGENVSVGNSVYDTTGNYIDVLTAANGCDSVVYTNISVDSPSVWQWGTSICNGDSVIVGNSVYNTVGIYTDTLTTSSGCDSIVYTNISIDYNTSSYDTLSVTASIVWNGMPLNASGDYSLTLINSLGCDSIVNLNLTITTTGISDIVNTKSNLVKITNMLGQETPYRRNTPLFYIYDDGTVEKRIVIE